jgi:hypothetical protein
MGIIEQPDKTIRPFTFAFDVSYVNSIPGVIGNIISDFLPHPQRVSPTSVINQVIVTGILLS